LKDGDLVAQRKDFDVFVPIAHRQQPQRGEGVRDGQIGQAKEHERSSCRARLPLLWPGPCAPREESSKPSDLHG
jgi:hypothetical protein